MPNLMSTTNSVEESLNFINDNFHKGKILFLIEASNDEVTTRQKIL